MARANLLSTSGVVNVDASGMTELVAKLQGVAPALAETLAARLQEAGEAVADAARVRAGYSTKIPGSIHVFMAGGFAVAVSTSLPEAVAIENHGRGFVRHPVFGTRDHWTTERSHPAFLYPTLLAMRPQVYETAVEAIHDAFSEVGLGD